MQGPQGEAGPPGQQGMPGPNVSFFFFALLFSVSVSLFKTLLISQSL